MKITITVVALALLVGCSDLPGHDDPRESVEYLESGSGEGAMPPCDNLPVPQCNNGCAVATGCVSPVLARCASHRDGNSCETDTSCNWESWNGSCAPSDICDIYDIQVECERSSSGCAWTAACGGTSKECSDFDTQPACQEHSSCAWTHES